MTGWNRRFDGSTFRSRISLQVTLKIIPSSPWNICMPITKEKSTTVSQISSLMAAWSVNLSLGMETAAWWSLPEHPVYENEVFYVVKYHGGVIWDSSGDVTFKTTPHVKSDR